MGNVAGLFVQQKLGLGRDGRGGGGGVAQRMEGCKGGVW